MRRKTLMLLTGFLAGVLSLAGCAAGPSATAPRQSMPEMLRAAGFKAYVATTQQQMAYLQSCPKDVLATQQRPGQVCYSFADPATNTVYLGDKAAYDRLQQALAAQEEKVTEQRIQNDPEFWSLWESMQGGGG